MKIISKYKDYYDYLQGIYGIDNLVVLDRTNFDNIEIFKSDYEDTTISFFICGKRIDGIIPKNTTTILFKDDTLEYLNLCKWTNKYHTKRNRRNNIFIPYIIDDNTNDEMSCPIIIKYANTYYKYPPLKHLGISCVFTPEELFIELYSWLTKEKDIPNTQTNDGKIISAGFDLKTSFRKIK